MSLPNLVVVHPLVLLSVVDHYNRVIGKNKNKRVVGALLGYYEDKTLQITNSFAIPFEEDPKEQHIWFLDHIYHETMFDMFRKINQKEKVVGWYTTGTKFKTHDTEINEIFKRYCALKPVLVIIDVEQSDELSLPTEAYCAVEEVKNDGSIVKNFVHLASSVEAFEPEEVGVEHLLREIKDVSTSDLGHLVNQKVIALRGLINKMKMIRDYLQNVLEKKVPVNNKILFNLQEIFNLLPNIRSEEMLRAFNNKTNDNMLAIYMASTIRSIISLHNLINNKLQNKENEKGIEAKTEKAPEKPTEKTGDKNETTSTEKPTEKKN